MNVDGLMGSNRDLFSPTVEYRAVDAAGVVICEAKSGVLCAAVGILDERGGKIRLLMALWAKVNLVFSYNERTWIGTLHDCGQLWRQPLRCMKVFLPVGIFTPPPVAHVRVSVAVTFELTLEEHSLKNQD